MRVEKGGRYFGTMVEREAIRAYLQSDFDLLSALPEDSPTRPDRWRIKLRLDTLNLVFTIEE